MFTLEDLREKATLSYIYKNYNSSEFHLFLECIFMDEDVDIDIDDLYVPDIHFSSQYCMELHKWILNHTLSNKNGNSSVDPPIELIDIDSTPYANSYTKIRREFFQGVEDDILKYPCNGLFLGTLLMFLTVYRDRFSDFQSAIQESLKEVDRLFMTRYSGLTDFQNRMIECFPDIVSLFNFIYDNYMCVSNENSLMVQDGDESIDIRLVLNEK